MSRSRRTRWLLVVVVVLSVALSIRLHGRSEHHSEAPWQLPVSTATADSTQAVPATKGESRRYVHSELDLLPLSIPRQGKGAERVAIQQVGPRWIGTNDNGAAEKLVEASNAFELGQLAQAAAIARRGLELDPDFPQLLKTACVIELKREDGDPVEAERFARLATQRAPMYTEAHYNLACALARQGRAADAAASLSEAIRWAHVQNLDVLGAVNADADFDRVRQSPEIQSLVRTK